jgi:Uma2 family endonuclease
MAMARKRVKAPRFRTVADLQERIGHVPQERIRLDVPPGTATVRDVIRIEAKENRLCELVDGVLVEKPMGAAESLVAGEIFAHVRHFVLTHKLGIALGADGTLKLLPRQVRIPDVSFIPKSQLPGGFMPLIAVPEFVPDLAVEVLSESNTRAEMERKLREYFFAGTRLVWYVDVPSRTIDVFTAPDQVTHLGPNDTLDGGVVLPGFSVPIAAFFELFGPQPTPAKRSRKRPPKRP